MLKTKDLGDHDLDPVWTQFANHFEFGRTSDPVLEAEWAAIHVGDQTGIPRAFARTRAVVSALLVFSSSRETGDEEKSHRPLHAL